MNDMTDAPAKVTGGADGALTLSADFVSLKLTVKLNVGRHRSPKVPSGCGRNGPGLRMQFLRTA